VQDGRIWSEWVWDGFGGEWVINTTAGRWGVGGDDWSGIRARVDPKRAFRPGFSAIPCQLAGRARTDAMR